MCELFAHFDVNLIAKLFFGERSIQSNDLVNISIEILL